MELSGDLVAIQGILSSVIKITGEFTKINYKGGNEQKILDVLIEIQKYITNKNYIKHGKINTVYDKQLEEIVFFLAINTKYSKPLELKDYYHLMNIMPQLSKCLFANIVYGLDLCKYYCKVIEMLPTTNGIELLDEMIPCLKKSEPKIHLAYAFMFLKTIADKLISNDFSEKDENIEKLTDVSYIILQGLTGLYSDQTKNLKAMQIYQHMGYIVLNLFDLLLYCNKDILNLKKFVNNALETSISLIKNVTITVFCSWAEIHENDQPLQTIIAERAYLFIEKYQKYTEAKELVSMLGTIAKKPKTLFECIQESDTPTIINKISKNDQDQKAWFQALLGTQIFQNEEAMQCVSTWAHLCNENDVTRLLNLTINSNSVEAKKLAVKCASTLSLEKLILVVTRYFFENKFKNVLNADVQPQLMLIFNKLGQANTIEDFIKEITLLLLQNPTVVLTYIYNECLKNKFYTDCLKDFFLNIIEISKIDDKGVDVLKNVMLENRTNLKNVNNHVELFQTLLKIGYFSNIQIIKILFPILRQLYTEECYQDLNTVLEIFLDSAIRLPAKKENEHVIKLLLDIMSDCRCKFLEFDSIKQQNAKLVVDILMNLCEVNSNYNFKVELMDTDDDFTTYYKKYLSSEINSFSLSSFYPDFDIENYAECVSRLIHILPSSVSSEWLWISEEINNKYSTEKTMELLSDVAILLCQLVNTQNDKNQQITFALKYCLQQFGLVVQKIQASSTAEDEVYVTKNVCRLLRHLPEQLKKEEGLSLTNILSERSLKSLANEKEFVCLLISINSKSICQTLAQRMT